MKRIVIVILLTAITVSAQPGRCACRIASENETTQWGWIVDRTIEGGAVKALRGRILDAAETPIPNALVEVLDHPEVWLGEKGYYNRDKQKRLAACVVGANGEFCFSKLPPGKYELRASGPSGFDPMHVILKLAPHDRRSKQESIVVTLEVSQ
ncbi:MAG: carboxypeptidase regulatory-like domain-containing protein [Acidobacteria bacterium]|nr:carboxypeptidase regulatory-like domain-containing protein [Acidobacteriota bacterium]MCW5969178.1 carboxypeptidase regulatory-like domain-containing protein [Blastocatellales bacterium]